MAGWLTWRPAEVPDIWRWGQCLLQACEMAPVPEVMVRRRPARGSYYRMTRGDAQGLYLRQDVIASMAMGIYERWPKGRPSWPWT